MEKNLFYVETVHLFSTRKLFAIIGNILEGKFEKGMQIINEVKGIRHRIDSIEHVYSNGKEAIGILIRFDNIKELESLELLEKGDILLSF